MENLDLSIRKNRTEDVTVTVTQNGIPAAYQDIVVQQKAHKFLFGSNWGEKTIELVNGEL